MRPDPTTVRNVNRDQIQAPIVIICDIHRNWYAEETELRTGWFLESVVSPALIVLVVRTRWPFFRSRPARPPTIATLVVVGLTLLLPYSPLAPIAGFVPLPTVFVLALGPNAVLYSVAAGAAKFVFYRREDRPRETGLAARSTRPIGVSQLSVSSS
jgi:magnesium-transporting ATPase (P-type)